MDSKLILGTGAIVFAIGGVGLGAYMLSGPYDDEYDEDDDEDNDVLFSSEYVNESLRRRIIDNQTINDNILNVNNNEEENIILNNSVEEKLTNIESKVLNIQSMLV
jgi:hypothetical protein